MAGTVYVKFSNDSYAKEYAFKLPWYIDLNEIQDYVIVPNAIYDKNRDVSPYKICKVVRVSPYDDSKATRAIADYINGELYREVRNEENITMKFDNLSLEVKESMLKIYEAMKNGRAVWLG